MAKKLHLMKGETQVQGEKRIAPEKKSAKMSLLASIRWNASRKEKLSRWFSTGEGAYNDSKKHIYYDFYDDNRLGRIKGGMSNKGLRKAIEIREEAIQKKKYELLEQGKRFDRKKVIMEIEKEDRIIAGKQGYDSSQMIDFYIYPRQ